MSFEIHCGVQQDTAVLHLSGALDDDVALAGFRAAVADVPLHRMRRLVVEVRDLTRLSAPGVRGLLLVQQELPADAAVVVVGAGPQVGHALDLAGFGGSATMSAAVTPDAV